MGNSLAIVVVGGSAKDVGKTALVCAVIAALSDFAWTAVKITGHGYEPAHSAGREGESSKLTIREESSAEDETDTARYLAAGARRALLVTGFRTDGQAGEIQRALAGDRSVIFESNRIIDVVRPDVCLALIGGSGTELKPSFLMLLHKADAMVSVGGELQVAEAPPEILRFSLQSPDCVSPELVSWLRTRLAQPAIESEWRPPRVSDGDCGSRR